MGAPMEGWSVSPKWPQRRLERLFHIGGYAKYSLSDGREFVPGSLTCRLARASDSTAPWCCYAVVILGLYIDGGPSSPPD